MQEIKRRTQKIWNLFWPYLIFMFIGIVILWVQKNNHAFFIGADSVFHLNQFYDSAMQIKTGHFSWFLSQYGFSQAGRIVNALYGPLFSYLIGGLLLLVGTWTRMQLLMDFAVLCISGMLMYHLSRYLNLKRYISIILGIIYMSSYPVTTWVNEQTFSGIGDTLLPLVILIGIKTWKKHKIQIIPMAVILAIVLQIHVLTYVVSVFALAPFIMLSFIKTAHKVKWIRHLIYSVALSFLLSFNIWGSMLDVFGSSHIIKPFANAAMGNSDYSLGWFNGTISIYNNIFILIGLFALTLIILNWKSSTWKQRVIPCDCLLFYFISSTYFPWTTLSRICPLISQCIQFPKRFIGIATVLLLLTIGLGLKHLNINSLPRSGIIKLVIICLLIFMAGGAVTEEEDTIENHVQTFQGKEIFITPYQNLHKKMNLWKIRDAFNSKNISLVPKDVIKAVPDYLPSNKKMTPQRYHKINEHQVKNVYNITFHEIMRQRFVKNRLKHHKKHQPNYWISTAPLKSKFHYNHYVKDGSLFISWKQPRKLLYHNTQIPAVKYGHTLVRLNNHKLNNVKIDAFGAIHMKPKQIKNTIQLKYKASMLWKLFMIVWGISWIGLISYVIKKLVIN